jgi:hypothetical protein
LHPHFFFLDFLEGCAAREAPLLSLRGMLGAGGKMLYFAEPLFVIL